MNETRFSGASLEQAILAKLEEILTSIGWLKDWRINREAGAGDLILELPLPAGGRSSICIECKKDLRPSQFASLSAKPCLPGNRRNAQLRVLAMPWISPRMAEMCREGGWGWLDLAGNCRLDIPGVFHIERKGNLSAHKRPGTRATFSSNEAARVIRLLLMPESSSTTWTQRKIQQECRPGVSLGLVNKVVRRLIDDSYVRTGPPGGLRLHEPEKLLFAWQEEYRFERHERRGYFTLLTGKAFYAALAKLNRAAAGKTALASFSAADFQAPHVRQAKTWLFLDASMEETFRMCLEAKPVESGENLVVLFPADDGVFFRCDEASVKPVGLPCTNLVQTYVDLASGGGRGSEAAKALLDQRLKPIWSKREPAP